jgi:excisionase family DNA binding protein
MNTTFLTPRDIAHMLKISRALAYRLIAHGEIPSIQFGRVSRVRQEDLDTFIQQSARRPNSDSPTEPNTSDGLLEKPEIQQDT